MFTLAQCLGMILAGLICDRPLFFSKCSHQNSGTEPLPGHKVSTLNSGTKQHLGAQSTQCLNPTFFVSTQVPVLGWLLARFCTVN